MTITATQIEQATIRKEITPRGGGIEIDLTPFGIPGEKMAAYQNYLGGGLLGKVCSNDTIRCSTPFVELELAQKLDQISEALKEFYFNLTNPGGEWEKQDYITNQKMPESAY